MSNWKKAGGFDTEKWVHDTKGDSLEGTFEGYGSPVMLDGKAVPKLLINGTEGTKFGVLANKVLQGQFDTIPVGSMVRITYLGKQKPKSGGKPYNNYETEFDDSSATGPAPAANKPASARDVIEQSRAK